MSDTISNLDALNQLKKLEDAGFNIPVMSPEERLLLLEEERPSMIYCPTRREFLLFEEDPE